jgi:hypothetical protein
MLCVEETKWKINSVFQLFEKIVLLSKKKTDNVMRENKNSLFFVLNNVNVSDVLSVNNLCSLDIVGDVDFSFLLFHRFISF